MPARTVTLELSEEQAQWVDERVAEGFPDAAAVVSDAVDAAVLDSKLAQAAVDDIDKEEIRAAVARALERLDKGTAHLLSADEVFGRKTEGYFARLAQR